MIVACVRTGTRYPVDYVHRLRAMVARHMPPISYTFACLTDRPDELAGVDKIVDITADNLPGWWGKMALFKRQWRIGNRVVYLDLDTVVCGDLSPMTALRMEFAICENFARLAGVKAWPCRYGSCVMMIGPTMDSNIWEVFNRQRGDFIAANAIYGDQHAIETIHPNATLLQKVLPEGFMISYRDLKEAGPGRASIVNFGGKHKPDNSRVAWVKDAWL